MSSQGPNSRRSDTEYRCARVSVTRGPDTGLRQEFFARALRVGRSDQSDLCLSDPAVSERHCTLEASKEGVRVREERASTGVFLNGTRVYDALVQRACELTLGATTLFIEPLSELQRRAQSTRERFGELIGPSRAMRELFAELELLAPTRRPLLVEGESGTGRTLIAESVHDESSRASGPFVVVDCQSTEPEQIALALFGGAPSPATGEPQRSAFERAHGGSLLLEEIAALPAGLAARVLTVLDSGELGAPGASQTQRVDVRLLATTENHLATQTARGRFPEELLARLTSGAVEVPPLRERLEDLRPLVDHFAVRARLSTGPVELPAELWAMLESHRWPGNVRELSSLIPRLLGSAERASNAPLGRALRSGAPGPQRDSASLLPLRLARREASDDFERSYLESVLTRTGGNVTRAAAIAEVSRQMVQKLMRKHGIE